MSGSAFLRRHGWQMGAELWFHRRLPLVGHSFVTALQQQAQWLELELEALKRERAAHMEEPET